MSTCYGYELFLGGILLYYIFLFLFFLFFFAKDGGATQRHAVGEVELQQFCLSLHGNNNKPPSLRQ